ESFVECRGSALWWKQEQPPGCGTGIDGVQEAVEGAQRGIAFRAVVAADGNSIGELGSSATGFAVDQSNEQAREIAEQLIQQRTIDTGRIRDAVRGRGMKALGVDDRL